MSEFWKLSSGEKPSGTAEASHVADFSVIPDGTMALAQIKEFALMEPNNSYHHQFYEIVFKISSELFKGREVRMKIKCFDDKTNVKDRGVNLMKRVYDLCGVKPAHSNAPTTQDLYPFVSKVLGIKISEFIGTKQDGSPSNGNYVSEVHKADHDFVCAIGAKLEVPVAIESAFSRNPTGKSPELDGDIPF